MDFNLVIYELKQEEGFVSSVYKDHLGFYTIGHGICVDDRKNSGITEEESIYLMTNRVMKAAEGLDRNILWWRTLHPGAKRALILMAYQLGVQGVLSFKKMLAAAKQEKYLEMKKEGLDSKWAKIDTPERARRVMDLVA